MPSKNQTKLYIMGASYHVYNRGVNKDLIFSERSDYRAFIRRIQALLTPPEVRSPSQNKYKIHFQSATLLAYCLMPNHFHLLLVNQRERGIEAFMRSLSISYSMYFNRKYGRVGPLFQSSYNAPLISSEGALLRTAAYIHRNPLDLGISLADLRKYSWSNFDSFLQEKEEPWFDTGRILNRFKDGGRGYGQFVENQ